MHKNNIKSLAYIAIIPSLLLFSAGCSNKSEPASNASPTVKVIAGVQTDKDITFDTKLYKKPYCAVLAKAAARIYEGGTESLILKKIEPILTDAKITIDKTGNVQLKDTYNTSLNIIRQGRYPDIDSENIEERYAWRQTNRNIIEDCGFSLDIKMAK